MKKLFLVIAFFAITTLVNADTDERKVLNLNLKSFFLESNGNISIVRSRKLDNSILLLKNIETTSFTDKQLYQDAIAFYEKLVKKYKFKDYDRPNLAYGLFKNNYGFIKNRIYQIDIDELKKLNNRDFGKNDLNAIDKNLKPVPIEIVFQNIKVIDVRELSENINETKVLQNYLKKFPLGGSLGAVETMVKANWEGKYDKKTGVKKILNNSDGSKAIICNSGGYGTITFPNPSICAMGNNKKSICKQLSNWSIEQASNYICK